MGNRGGVPRRQKGMRLKGMRCSVRPNRLVRVGAIVAGAGLVAALVGGCGDTTEPAEKTALSGRAFTAIDAQGLVLPPGSNLRLTFDGLSVRMTGGCNTGTADYDVQDDLLIIESMALTEMACEEDLMALDAAVVALLTSRPTVRLVADELTVLGAGVSLRLSDEFVPAADRPLEETLWVVTSVLHLDTAAGGFGTARATVRFVGDTVEVNGGCNAGIASAAIGDTSIEFGVLGLTKMACPQSTMELEFSVALVVQGTASYRIDGDQLTLLNGEYGLLLEAAAAA
ncbi:MAG: META domain-containing protein [Actinomycetota bacterium]|nr:META domain-containing protein [Actinomycetota bacterium]